MRTIVNSDIFELVDFGVAGGESLNQRLKSAYRDLDIKYPKFYKMDTFCKVGFLTMEHLMIKAPVSFDPAKTGIFLVNQYSSIDTDLAFHRSYSLHEESLASPGLFVYTLPNILIGELAIRHKITGEHGFFILSDFQSDFIYLYVKSLLDSNVLDAAILGTCEVFQDEVLCAMKLVSSASVLDESLSFDLSKFKEWIKKSPQGR